MPTPTIDPAAYEAAYQAARQFTIDRSVMKIFGLLVVVSCCGFSEVTNDAQDT